MTLLAGEVPVGGSSASTIARAPSRAAVELAAINDRFEHAPTEELLYWADDRFGRGLSVVASFQTCVLIDLVTRVDPTVDVVFLDTGSHFAETLEFVAAITARYRLEVRVIEPGCEAAEWPCGSARCCELRKVAPLTRALQGRDAWMSGVKRVDTDARASAPLVGWDAVRGMFKFNPLARWTDDDITAYERANGLPVHPLRDTGYRSIGCAPTTRPVAPFEPARSGRWPGSEKTECGLHS